MAVLLPLQAMAAMPNCAATATYEAPAVTQLSRPASADHCEHHGHNVQHPQNIQQHDCGSCCSVAAAGNPLLHWQAPRFTAPYLSIALVEPPPSIAIERLDRPPRTHST